MKQTPTDLILRAQSTASMPCFLYRILALYENFKTIRSPFLYLEYIKFIQYCLCS